MSNNSKKQNNGKVDKTLISIILWIILALSMIPFAILIKKTNSTFFFMISPSIMIIYGLGSSIYYRIKNNPKNNEETEDM